MNNNDGGENQEQKTGALAQQIDRVLFGFLFLMVLCAPHSIAATQTAWVLTFLVWVVRLCVRPCPMLHRTPVDIFFVLIFLFTFLSAVFSYSPHISFPLLRGVLQCTIVFLIAQNVFASRHLRILALTLVLSCTVNVFYSFAERVVGRGVKIEGLKETSPLYVGGVRSGDTLLEVNGQKLHSFDELYNALSSSGSEPAKIKIYRYEYVTTFDVECGKFLDGQSQLEKVGISSWSRGRDWRAAGFYGHYTTYSEVLQLILSLSVGLFIALEKKLSWQGVLLAVVVISQGISLLMTVTRASWLAFLISAFVIVLTGASRRTILILAVIALVVVPAGLFLLQQKRNVGFFDSKDNSTTYRGTVWREGFSLLISKPRHWFVGVGMNSLKEHWREWGLFDNGKLPMGHMHSTYLQLGLERGFPALLVWLALIFVYGRMLFRLARSQSVKGWIERGIILGALGGLVGFMTSAIVHYNWGDSEVVMVFYIIMGFCLVIERKSKLETEEIQA